MFNRASSSRTAYLWVFEKQEYRNIFQATRVLQPVLVYIGGPLIPFFQLIRLYGKANKEIEQAELEAEEGQGAEAQYVKYGSTNLPFLSSWAALDKRQLAGLAAQEAAKATFIKLNIYYLCYLVLVILLLFVAYQFGDLHQH